jgi:hypothetical protein
MNILKSFSIRKSVTIDSTNGENGNNETGKSKNAKLNWKIIRDTIGNKFISFLCLQLLIYNPKK